MRKIIYTNIPAHGHINPTLPVVQELVARGEQVIYYATEEFRPQIERAGATFVAYPATQISANAIATALQDGNLANVTILLLQATEELLPFMLDELTRERPDLVIFDSTVIWGKMAATLLNLRTAASISHLIMDLRSSGMTWREILRMLRQTLPRVPLFFAARRRLIRRYGKHAFPAGSPLFPMRGGLNLVFTARALQPESAIIDQTFRFVGPSINPQTRAEDADIQTTGQGPQVYISLGTVHTTHLDFYRQCLQTFADYPAQFILSTGKHTDLAALGPIPPNFLVRPTVPQLAVPQQTDVFITHGGINSVHEGLYYGVPLLLIPHQFEQLLNARQVAAQGAGIVLDQQVMGGAIQTNALRAALTTLLTQPQYRQAASQLQQQLRATGGYRQVADEIQAYLATTLLMGMNGQTSIA